MQQHKVVSRSATAESEIRDFVYDMLEAIRSRDIERIMSHYAPDVLAFDAILQLQFKGIEAYRAHWQQCFDYCQGDMVFEIHELGVTAGDDLAFCHYLIRCGGVDESGKEKTGWMRATGCFGREAGGWRIVHEHFSSPFDPQSGKALMDLQP